MQGYFLIFDGSPQSFGKTGTHGILALFCAARMQHLEPMVNESRRPSGRCGDAWLTRSHRMVRSRLSARSLNGRNSTEQMGDQRMGQFLCIENGKSGVGVLDFRAKGQPKMPQQWIFQHGFSSQSIKQTVQGRGVCHLGKQGAGLDRLARNHRRGLATIVRAKRQERQFS
jgi:hypothetical protein